MTISSVSGREIDFASAAYGTFKAALVHYTQALAYHLAGKGIRANTVSPGNTYFPGGIWSQIETGNPELFNMALGLNPTGRMGTPQEMANAVAFIASRASSSGPTRRRRCRTRASALTIASNSALSPRDGVPR